MRTPQRRQAGFTLIEGLVAILIFSLGVLALIGLQVNSVRQSSNAKYRSDAALHLLHRIGGGWRRVAALGRLVPRGLRDAVYDLVARVRYRVFGRKDEACPVIPPALRSRFDL